MLPEGYEIAYTLNVFGFELRRTNHGLLVDQVVNGSAAEQAGIRRGDQMVKVAAAKVSTLSEYERAIEDRLGRLPLVFTVIRNNTAYLVKLP